MYQSLLTLIIIVIIYVPFEILFTSLTDVRKIIMFNGEKFHRRYRKIKEIVNRQKIRFPLSSKILIYSTRPQ
nr:Uncharacterised protein [Escherichia coli]